MCSVHACMAALCYRSHAPHPDVCQVVFFDPVSGREQAAFDYSGDDDARAFASLAASPGGDAVVAGAHERLHVFARGGPHGVWQAAGVKQVGGGSAACPSAVA